MKSSLAKSYLFLLISLLYLGHLQAFDRFLLIELFVSNLMFCFYQLNDPIGIHR